MRHRFTSAQALAMWALASAGAVAMLLLFDDAAHVGAEYIPLGNDAFYHARRILDLAADPTSLREFDERVHVPEGSALIWPWGYDYFMALLTRALAELGNADRMTVLAHLPTMAIPLSLGCVVLACRELGLSASGASAALVATMLMPLNLNMYGVSRLDHHFAEHFMILATLAAVLHWLAAPRRRSAVIAGAVLGFAVCIHNGLFILQLPVAALLALQWLARRPLPAHTRIFSVTLILATLLAALPSAAIHEGSFEFFRLSWFHVYVAACTGGFAIYLSRHEFIPSRLAGVACIAVAVLVPLTAQVALAGRFLSTGVEGAQNISEMMPVWELVASRHSLAAATDLYTPLVLLLPATMLLCAVQAWREQSDSLRYFWIASLMGVLLMASHVRMHPFGTFALALTWIVFIDGLRARNQLPAPATNVVMAVIALVACIPLRAYAAQSRMPGDDVYYALTREIYPVLRRHCEARPGTVLVNLDDGNYVLFHTDCSVIANNFLLTPLQEAKVREVRDLMQLTPDELARRVSRPRYVLVRRQTLFAVDEAGRMVFEPRGHAALRDPRLVNQLLAADPAALPPGFRLLNEQAFERPAHIPYARLFELEAAAYRGQR